ncbi:hypothetical protein FPZ12_043835 [Amycolatopsis acidicola]|uniref:Trypsin-co-occurring domain-containing protein n=1 Tax=Amycolatopsis acidicola TaxID=2596893 RepID=A0A5N0UPW8_9PSEU|nr:CU044_2847 family protein [Amycolatopsis acidicola]KAA9149136.1 hypothetical protein FPZ12_043835 [Amycolatopsis acidicola]
MARVFEMELDDGSTVLVEAADDDPGIERVGRARDVVTEASETLKQAVDRVRPAVSTVLDGLRELPRPPESIKLEFGIKFTAEAGVVVARAATEANFKVTVGWSAES